QLVNEPDRWDQGTLEPVENLSGPEVQRFEGSPAITFREPPDPAREMSETVILALRLREGLDLCAFERRFGIPLADVFGEPLADTQSLGLTELSAGRLRIPNQTVLAGDAAG